MNISIILHGRVEDELRSSLVPPVSWGFCLVLYRCTWWWGPAGRGSRPGRTPESAGRPGSACAGCWGAAIAPWTWPVTGPGASRGSRWTTAGPASDRSQTLKPAKCSFAKLHWWLVRALPRFVCCHLLSPSGSTPRRWAGTWRVGGSWCGGSPAQRSGTPGRHHTHKLSISHKSSTKRLQLTLSWPLSASHELTNK